jgi:hypothetical protein
LNHNEYNDSHLCCHSALYEYQTYQSRLPLESQEFAKEIDLIGRILSVEKTEKKVGSDDDGDDEKQTMEHDEEHDREIICLHAFCKNSECERVCQHPFCSNGKSLLDRRVSCSCSELFGFHAQTTKRASFISNKNVGPRHDHHCARFAAELCWCS